MSFSEHNCKHNIYETILYNSRVPAHVMEKLFSIQNRATKKIKDYIMSKAMNLGKAKSIQTKLIYNFF